ncbi:hypothetical protein Tco_1189028 [Tanacetum coccineum]
MSSYMFFKTGTLVSRFDDFPFYGADSNHRIKEAYKLSDVPLPSFMKDVKASVVVDGEVVAKPTQSRWKTEIGHQLRMDQTRPMSWQVSMNIYDIQHPDQLLEQDARAVLARWRLVTRKTKKDIEPSLPHSQLEPRKDVRDAILTDALPYCIGHPDALRLRDAW